MRRTAFAALLLLFNFPFLAFNTLMAQAPQGFTYQAVVRDNSGNPVANSQVSVRIELVQGSANGTVQYAESHSPMTDGAGLFTIVIGQGVPLVNCLFADCVDWTAGPWFLTSRIDPAGGNSYSLVTTQQLMSVPYALYAANAGSAVHIRDSVVVYIRDSVVYDTIDTYSYDSHPADIIGALPGVFSISPANRIAFSSGNLQYKASTDTWRFAEHQWDIVGTANANISATDTLWIDLFGYGTSGYNNHPPYTYSTYFSAYPSTTIAASYYDWGLYNAISNGGDSAGLWRTLSNSEWGYILSGRTDASSLRALATVNGMPGLILLPDSWSGISGINIITTAYSYTSNSYNASQWAQLEAAGAVFLPAAGYREGVTLYNVGTKGRYYSATIYSQDNSYAQIMYFNTLGIDTSRDYRDYGSSVRLVHDLTVLP